VEQHLERHIYRPAEQNLRENKHGLWDAVSVLSTAGQRPYLVLAQVQTDKTKDSLVEMVKEIDGMAGARPATAAELQAAVDQATKSLPARVRLPAPSAPPFEYRVVSPAGGLLHHLRGQGRCTYGRRT